MLRRTRVLRGTLRRPSLAMLLAGTHMVRAASDVPIHFRSRFLLRTVPRAGFAGSQDDKCEFGPSKPLSF